MDALITGGMVAFSATAIFVIAIVIYGLGQLQAADVAMNVRRETLDRSRPMLDRAKAAVANGDIEIATEALAEAGVEHLRFDAQSEIVDALLNNPLPTPVGRFIYRFSPMEQRRRREAATTR